MTIAFDGGLFFYVGLFPNTRPRPKSRLQGKETLRMGIRQPTEKEVARLYAQPVLKRGDEGQTVTYLQTALRHHGHIVKSDGRFGAMTESAVKEFQKSCGLNADGIVGVSTWFELLKG